MPSRRAALRAAAACVVAPFAHGCHQILGPSSYDANWQVFDRGRLTFYARPSSFAAQSIDPLFTVLDDQYNASVAMLAVEYAAHISMYLYADPKDGDFAGNFSGVAYPDTLTVRATCLPPLDANLMSLLSHEMNHVITRNTLGQSGTAFMTEGIASAVITERYHSNGRHFYYPWTASHLSQLPPIASLLDDEFWNRSNSQIAYSASASFLAWLIDTRGPAPLKQVFTVRSNEAVGRIGSVYGQPVTQLESEWKAFCVAYKG